ncbi:hypothetical protein U1Q18_052021 [Sarracenia purpurea var. burkii]
MVKITHSKVLTPKQEKKKAVTGEEDANDAWAKRNFNFVSFTVRLALSSKLADSCAVEMGNARRVVFIAPAEATAAAACFHLRIFYIRLAMYIGCVEDEIIFDEAILFVE